MEQSFNPNPNLNSNSLVNVTLPTKPTPTPTPTSMLAENQKETSLVTLAEALSDVRAQFKRGEFMFEEPQNVGDFFKISKPTAELDRLIENIRRDFKVDKDMDLTPLLFQLNHPSISTFSLTALLAPDLWWAKCYITWVEKKEQGGAYYHYGNDAASSSRTPLEDDDKVWNYEGGKISVDEGRGGVYLVLMRTAVGGFCLE